RFTKLAIPTSAYFAGATIGSNELELAVSDDGRVLSSKLSPSGGANDSEDSTEDGVEKPEEGERSAPYVAPDVRVLMISVLFKLAPDAQVDELTPVYGAATPSSGSPVGYTIDFSRGEDVNGTLSITSDGVPVQLEVNVEAADLPPAVTSAIAKETKGSEPTWL